MKNNILPSFTSDAWWLPDSCTQVSVSDYDWTIDTTSTWDGPGCDVPAEWLGKTITIGCSSISSNAGFYIQDTTTWDDIALVTSDNLEVTVTLPADSNIMIIFQAPDTVGQISITGAYVYSEENGEDSGNDNEENIVPITLTTTVTTNTNWTESMQQTFEYYIVDPNTWADTKKLDNVKSCTISRDADAESLGSSTIDVTESVGECYIRVYLVAIQNGFSEKYPLGTFLVQTPSSNFNGKIRNVSMDAYTPLIELKEKQPPIGYSVLKDANIMDNVYLMVRENVRAPVVKADCSEVLYGDFVADAGDTWMRYTKDLMANAKYEYALDEMGRILFSPKQDLASLQPVWTYDDSNSSILYPEIDMNHDLYKIPNVVEVIYSSGKDYYYARVVNDDPNSPISTVNRGREIVHRETNPDLIGRPTDMQIQEYAKNLLRTLSAVEYTISYSHGYCPVRLGDCVRLNYEKAGLTNIKAKVISQQIQCKPGCVVTERAVFTTKLWR